MDDREFEAYLDRDSELSKLYRQAATERAPEKAIEEVLERASAEAPDAPEPSARPKKAEPLWWRILLFIFPSDDFLPPLWSRLIRATGLLAIVGIIAHGVTTDTTEPQIKPDPDVIASPPAKALPPATVIPAGTPEALAEPKTSTPPASAEAWLAEIDKLLEAGEQNQARVAFYAFRERYPNHSVPSDLLDRLGI